ncbi:MAG TPA: MogA/MoaB family molybdenum cofactor biosynthesis protein [bacterium]|nr:MogA/MoaB family molybdenum cofactor biosynthesis protein [bacterium]HOL46955.1 MogA/MoaB family molybdenum cofactor biosynthesis protein [bacterium]HPQ18220.1 MogA/MoaB family molybdenum cofactor biosynthesis protein [bacterium]
MRVGILTISDTRSFDNDESGKYINNYFKKKKYEICFYEIVKDEEKQIIVALKKFLKGKIDLIITTGGTGVAVRDVTPEVTKKVIKKEVPGIAEAIRNFSLKKNKNAMLSRGIAGIVDKTLIINLPGSKNAVSEILPYIIEPIEHCIDLLNGKTAHY